MQLLPSLNWGVPGWLKETQDPTRLHEGLTGDAARAFLGSANVREMEGAEPKGRTAHWLLSREGPGIGGLRRLACLG